MRGPEPSLAYGTGKLPIEVGDTRMKAGEDLPFERERETRDGWVVVREMEATRPLPPFTAATTAEGSPRLPRDARMVSAQTRR